MSIKVTCPNGHRLSAKDSRAGTTGRCPACGATVKIPTLENMAITESSILRLLDVGDGAQVVPPPDPIMEGTVPDMSQGMGTGTGKGTGTPKKPAKATQICPQCDWEIDAEYKICPNCRYYLIGKTGEY